MPWCWVSDEVKGGVWRKGWVGDKDGMCLQVEMAKGLE